MDQFFWDSIDATLQKKTVKQKISLLKQLLQKLNPEKMEYFLKTWHSYHELLYTTSIHSAGSLLSDGIMSDDDFEYFRSGLIMLGKKKLEEIIKNPDNLALLSKQDIKCLLDDETEFYNYTVSDIFEECLGETRLKEVLPLLYVYTESLPNGKEYSQNLESLGMDFPKLFALYQERQEKANEEFRKIDFDKLDPEGIIPDWLRNK